MTHDDLVTSPLTTVSDNYGITKRRDRGGPQNRVPAPSHRCPLLGTPPAAGPELARPRLGGSFLGGAHARRPTLVLTSEATTVALRGPQACCHGSCRGPSPSIPASDSHCQSHAHSTGVVSGEGPWELKGALVKMQLPRCFQVTCTSSSSSDQSGRNGRKSGRWPQHRQRSGDRAGRVAATATLTFRHRVRRAYRRLHGLLQLAEGVLLEDQRVQRDSQRPHLQLRPLVAAMGGGSIHGGPAPHVSPGPQSAGRGCQ